LNVFIFPPSFEHLEQRLRDRGLNTEPEIQTRLQKAIDEIDAGKEFYQYVIINDDLKVATECLKAAIIAKKLQTRTALDAIHRMAERLKEERDGRTARRALIASSATCCSSPSARSSSSRARSRS
jgi:guanylate kinase